MLMMGSALSPDTLTSKPKALYKDGPHGLTNFDIDDDGIAPSQRPDRFQTENVDAADLTNELLRVCNVVREKNFGSKILYRKSGVVCGARAGVHAVNEPVVRRNITPSARGTARRPGTNMHTRSRRPGTKERPPMSQASGGPQAAPVLAFGLNTLTNTSIIRPSIFEPPRAASA